MNRVRRFSHGVVRFFCRAARTVRKAVWVVHDIAIYATVPLAIAGTMTGRLSSEVEFAALLGSILVVAGWIRGCPSFERLYRHIDAKRHPERGGEVDPSLFPKSSDWYLTFSGFMAALTIDVGVLIAIFW